MSFFPKKKDHAGATVDARNIAPVHRWFLRLLVFNHPFGDAGFLSSTKKKQKTKFQKHRPWSSTVCRGKGAMGYDSTVSIYFSKSVGDAALADGYSLSYYQNWNASWKLAGISFDLLKKVGSQKKISKKIECLSVFTGDEEKKSQHNLK